MIDSINYLKTKTREYPVVMDFNVLEVIQNKYGTFEDWQHVIQGENKVIEDNKEIWKQGETKISDLKFFIKEAINEGIDIVNSEKGEKNPFVTDKEVGRIISEVGIAEVSSVIKEVVIASNNPTNNNEEIVENVVDDDVKANTKN